MGIIRVELAKDFMFGRTGFDHAKAREVRDALYELGNADRPGHYYVDIEKPTDTLVLSRDEYSEQP